MKRGDEIFDKKLSRIDLKELTTFINEKQEENKVLEKLLKKINEKPLNIKR